MVILNCSYILCNLLCIFKPKVRGARNCFIFACIQTDNAVETIAIVFEPYATTSSHIPEAQPSKTSDQLKKRSLNKMIVRLLK